MSDDAESILNRQSEDQPIVISSDGSISPASDGRRGLAINDAKGDYAE